MDAHGYEQAFTLLMGVVATLSWVAWAFKNRKRWLYSVPILSWLIHIIVFYIALFIVGNDNHMYAETFNIWSTSIRLHALFLAMAAVIVFWKDRKHLWN